MLSRRKEGNYGSRVYKRDGDLAHKQKHWAYMAVRTVDLF